MHISLYCPDTWMGWSHIVITNPPTDVTRARPTLLSSGVEGAKLTAFSVVHVLAPAVVERV